MKANFVVDAVIFLFFLIGFEPDLTGNAIHEWLNLCLAATIVVHLVLHWDWTAALLRRPFGRMSRKLRIDSAIDLLLFVTFVILMLSGLMISKSILGVPGAEPSRHSIWQELHSASGSILLLLVGMHFALHWKWIIHAWNYCFATQQKGRQRAAAAELN
jgi:hypothetical protein